MEDTPQAKPGGPQQVPVSHLQRRALQAPVAACLIREFARTLGEDQAIKIATSAIQSDAQAAGQQLAEAWKNNDIKELAQVVRDIWAQEDAISIRVLKETEKELSLRCAQLPLCRIV
jgi:hypothetical protein